MPSIYVRDPCRICGGEKEPGAARLYCKSCRETWMPHGRKLKPCLRCGGPKGSGEGRRYCDACREIRAQEKENYYKPHPCPWCGSREPKSPKRRLCDDCVALQATLKERFCQGCGKKRPPGPFKYCPECRSEREAARVARERVERVPVDVLQEGWKQCDLTTSELARRIKVDERYVARVLNGQPYYHGRPRRKYFIRSVAEPMALRFLEAMHLDPIDVGW